MKMEVFPINQADTAIMVAVNTSNFPEIKAKSKISRDKIKNVISSKEYPTR